MVEQIKIKEIDDKSTYLQTVIALGDANQATLSFFPKGAFQDYAARRKILGAFTSPEQCIGYLLYRTSRSYNRVTIIHLCLAPPYRGKGVAKKLVDHLIQVTQDYSGIGLTCRRDYQLQNLWSKLGFVAKYDEPAKTSGKINTYWWLDYGKSDLFSTAAVQKLESKLCVVIDAAIFFNLYNHEMNKNTEESQSLLANWLQPELDLCITDEIFNKINTINSIRDVNDRNMQHDFAKRFTCLPYNTLVLSKLSQTLKKTFQNHDISVNDSDTRYLAKIIAANCHIFVSRDSRFLTLADELYEKFKLSIVTPTVLINKLEHLQNITEYQPVRLAGTSLKQVRVQNLRDNSFYKKFNANKKGETKAEFQQSLRRFITENDKFECLLILEGEQEPTALVVYERHKNYELEIPMLRVRNNAFAGTLAHHLLFQAISVSAREHRSFTRVTDLYLQDVVKTAIQKNMFVTASNGWLKANIAESEKGLTLAMHLDEIANNLGQDYQFIHQFTQTLKDENAVNDISAMVDLERFLYPLKIIDANIPTFIIPINPFWAHQLFDSKLANQTIFGATKPNIALNREAVYYKSKHRPKQLKPGVRGRILWYVSRGGDRGYNGVSAVRACSRLEEVVIGKPKELYRRFRNLGIYELDNVIDIAQKQDDDIMAIRFCDTELFVKPVSLKNVKNILGKQSNIQSPVYISKEKFAKIYTLGIYASN